jgi:hypothetical protein
MSKELTSDDVCRLMNIGGEDEPPPLPQPDVSVNSASNMVPIMGLDVAEGSKPVAKEEGVAPARAIVDLTVGEECIIDLAEDDDVKMLIQGVEIVSDLVGDDADEPVQVKGKSGASQEKIFGSLADITSEQRAHLRTTPK